MFLISDFADEGFESAFRLASHTILIAIQLGDPREHNLPNAGLICFEDAETGKQRWIDSSSGTLRESFAKLARSRASFRETCALGPSRCDLRLYRRQALRWARSSLFESAPPAPARVRKMSTTSANCTPYAPREGYGCRQALWSRWSTTLGLLVLFSCPSPLMAEGIQLDASRGADLDHRPNQPLPNRPFR